MTSHFYCGVDVGASATKLVLVDEDGGALARIAVPSGVDYEATARGCLEQAKADAGLTDNPARTVSTGYGRHNVDFADKAMTEIHCHGLGCYHYFPRALSIIDIGGQDNKVIRLDDQGGRINFKMNRKCAAGTGAFIEEIALRLDVPVGEMDRLARQASDVVTLSSFCTVFAKTEILAHLRRGVPVGNIIRGAFRSVVDRVVEMDTLDGEVVLTGGVVAYNPEVAEILSEKVGRDVTLPPHPQFTGAMGAAVTALKQAYAGWS